MTRDFFSLNRRVYILGAIFVGLVLCLGLLTYTQATGTTIAVCISRDGEIRILSGVNTSCRRNETFLSWNTQGPKGDTGAPGAKGDKGDKGEKGDPGALGINGIDGISGWEKIQGEVVQSTNREVVAVAECPAGKKVLGGGYTVSVDGGTVQTLSNEPVGDTSWQIRIIGNVSFSAQAFALCASVKP